MLIVDKNDENRIEVDSQNDWYDNNIEWFIIHYTGKQPKTLNKTYSTYSDACDAAIAHARDIFTGFDVFK